MMRWSDSSPGISRIGMAARASSNGSTSRERTAAAASHPSLLRAIAEWFVQTNATKVCVDVDPANHSARRLYESHGARELNSHWLVWDDIGTIVRGG